ncbi:unnamed protein product, partial [marine sediment metagenome]
MIREGVITLKKGERFSPDFPVENISFLEDTKTFS